MKVREIIGCILMVVLSIMGIILCLGMSGILVFNSDGIMSSMLKTDYLENSEKEAKEIFLNYLPEDRVNEILNNISVKSQIREIAEAFDNNTVSQVANSFKETTKEEIIKVLDEDISKETKLSFAEVVSTSYIKTIFPVTEFGMISSIYNSYSSKVVLGLAILGIICAICYIYLALGKKTYKWAIIALYNIIIINVIILLLIGSLNGVVIGNDRTTSVIINMLGTIRFNIVVATVIIIVFAIISNYLAYYRRKKKKKK